MSYLLWHGTYHTGYRYLFKVVILFSLNIGQEGRLLCCIVVLFFHAVFHNGYTSLDSYQQCMSWPSLVISCFWWWPFQQLWNDLSLWSSFAFPQWLVTLSIFSYMCCQFLFFFEEMSIQAFCHMKSWIIYLFLLLSFISSLYS